MGFKVYNLFLCAIFLTICLNFPLSSSQRRAFGYPPPLCFFLRNPCRPSGPSMSTTEVPPWDVWPSTSTTTEDSFPPWDVSPSTSTTTEDPFPPWPAPDDTTTTRKPRPSSTTVKTTTTEVPPWHDWTSPTPGVNWPIVPSSSPPSNDSPQVELLRIAETCNSNFITQDYDEGWEEESGPRIIHQWPIRLTNKLFVYLMAFNMFESNGLSITEDQLEGSACFVTSQINGWGITNTTGFGGKHVTLRLTATSQPKVFRFVLPYGPIGLSSGTASLILSDNLHYNVFEFCFDNGLRAFAMFGRGEDLGQTDMDAVKLHMKAIGFKERHFLDLDPTFHCDSSGWDGTLWPRTGEYDLPKVRPPSKEIFKFINDNSQFPTPPLYWKKKK